MPYIGSGIQRFNTADGLTVNGNAEITGTAALTGNADFNGDLDVDGTTNLDATNVVGAFTVTGDVTLNDGSPNLRLNDTDTSRFIDILYGTRNATFRNTMASGEDMDTVAPEIIFQTKDDGETREHFRMNKSEAVFNEGSVDLDFRVESNGDANALFVDGGQDRLGIGTNNPQQPVHIKSGNGTLRLHEGDAADTKYAEIEVSNGKLILHSDRANVESNSDMQFHLDGSEAARINASKIFLVGKTSASATGTGVILDRNGQSFFGADTEPPIVVNRNNDDGNLMLFLQADSAEGTISVSGTTVSYNGGHLSRWSQATDGNRIDGLVKGTVMANLDQMAVWHHEAQAATYYTEDDELPEGVSVGDEKTPAVDAYDEDNEQLNCMAVSSVEGDANVAGVFVNWDNDDDFNDMNVAMTGDMVIRIAGGTTVARGDLLMSAGDGTAKPQGDDIVRSKTIAKVTSTTKSHTYDDGSYLVPCVLMAC